MPAAENLATIERLYAAMNAHDGEAMAACYTPDATFQDPAFGKLSDGGGQAMWRMLTSNPDYTFPDTGNKVHNDVRAAFVFRDGLIAEHVDTFSLRTWAAQALGTPGRILGLTPFLSSAITKKTSGRLAEFRGRVGA